MYHPCLCGAIDCPACTLLPRVRPPRRYALGLVSAEDLDILIEQAAADEEAESAYRRMLEDENTEDTTIAPDLF